MPGILDAGVEGYMTEGPVLRLKRLAIERTDPARCAFLLI
jgi:hypothetical protein